MTEAAATKTKDVAAKAATEVIAKAFERVANAPETIFQAAVRLDGKTYGVPQPGRHHDVFRAMKAHGLPTPIGGEQGFVTSKGRFVNRREGLQIAIANSQIIAKTDPEDQLFSEDMW